MFKQLSKQTIMEPQGQKLSQARMVPLLTQLNSDNYIFFKLDDLVQEAQTFIGLKKKRERERFESGDSACIIAKEWLKKYKLYILYKEVKRNNKPDRPEVNNHPGMINNEESLCESDADKSTQWVHGKSSSSHLRQLISTSEKTVIMHQFLVLTLEKDISTKLSQELWQFLMSCYDGQTIRRLAIPITQWSTSLETRLKRLPVIILPSSRLYVGGESLVGLEKEYTVQLPKKSKYGDVKKRLADCINAARGQLVGAESDGASVAPIVEADIRLQQYSVQQEKLLSAARKQLKVITIALKIHQCKMPQQPRTQTSN